MPDDHPHSDNSQSCSQRGVAICHIVYSSHNQLKKTNIRIIKYINAPRSWSHEKYSSFDFPAHSLFTFDEVCGSFGTSFFGNESSTVNNTRSRLPSRLSFRFYDYAYRSFPVNLTTRFFYKHMNFRNHARECLIKNCKKAQIVIVICLFQSFRKMSPISYVKGIRLYQTEIYQYSYSRD